MYLIAGLGNPGKDYKGTRHNVGFDTIDLLSEKHGINLNKAKFNSLYGDGIIEGKRVFLMKPTTYMNNSGIAIREFLDFYKLDIDSLIVIVDDIDIDFGTIRIKKKGSAGSHNGLKSIIYHLIDDNFIRIKIGIGSKHEGEDLANFVLSRFSKEDRITIDKSVNYAADSVAMILRDGVDDAMNIYNRRDLNELSL